MDADTLVRHRLPVVIVCGNNGAWGLEKHPMRALYGYDVLADLQPAGRYDEVVRALGGAGELVTAPSGIGPALRRAFAAGVPYLVNVLTDPEIAYPAPPVLRRPPPPRFGSGPPDITEDSASAEIRATIDTRVSVTVGSSVQMRRLGLVGRMFQGAALTVALANPA